MRIGEAPGGEVSISPLLRGRRSVSAFDSSHVLTDGELAALLEAARWAPSAGNSQPWSFLVGRRDDPQHRMFVSHLAPSVRRWAPAASALVFALQRCGVDADATSLAYSDYAAYDLGQSVAHLCIQAGALGLATHQFAAFDHGALAAATQTPPHWRVVTGVAIGVASEAPMPRDRRPLAEIAFAGTFGRALDLRGPTPPASPERALGATPENREPGPSSGSGSSTDLRRDHPARP